MQGDFSNIFMSKITIITNTWQTFSWKEFSWDKFSVQGGGTCEEEFSVGGVSRVSTVQGGRFREG